jgi:hypothetical protein
LGKSGVWEVLSTGTEPWYDDKARLTDARVSTVGELLDRLANGSSDYDLGFKTTDYEEAVVVEKQAKGIVARTGLRKMP